MTEKDFYKLLIKLNKFHQRCGVTILNGKPKQFLYPIRDWLFKISACLFGIMTLLASCSFFSNNVMMDRIINFLVGAIICQILIFETLFWFYRDKVLELVDSCRNFEVQTYKSLKKPNDWFINKRKITFGWIW